MLDKEYIYQAMRNQRLLYLTSRGRPYNFPAAAKGGIRSNTSGGSDPYAEAIQAIKDLLGSKLVELYDAKLSGITVNSANDATVLKGLINGYDLAVETNGPKWNELDTIYFVSGSQERMRNNSIIAALQNNSIGVFGNWQAVTSDTWMCTLVQAGGAAFMGLRNQGATFIWGGTGSTGTTNRNAGNNGQAVVYGLQVTDDVDLNSLVGTTVQTHVDTTISVPNDVAALNAMFIGSTGHSAPVYGTYFIRTLLLTNGLISTSDLATLGQLIADLTPAYETVFVAELWQSNGEGRSGDVSNPKYPFQTGKGREWNGSADIEIKTTRGGASGGSYANYFCEKFFELTGKVAIMSESCTSGTGLTSTASTPNWSASSTLRSAAETKINAGLAFYGKARPDWCHMIGGETDADTMDSNPAYTKAVVKAAFQDYINWWKTTYPGSKIIMTELGMRNSGDTLGWQTFRAIQHELAAENTDVHVAYTGAKDFPAQSKMVDEYHWNFLGNKDVGWGLAIFDASL